MGGRRKGREGKGKRGGRGGKFLQGLRGIDTPVTSGWSGHCDVGVK